MEEGKKVTEKLKEVKAKTTNEKLKASVDQKLKYVNKPFSK